MPESVRREAMFSRLAAALSRCGYPDFFDSLVTELAHILDVEYVLIAEVAAGSDEARTLALYGKGAILDNITYPLRGSPCETVPQREACFYGEDVAERFPDDALLQDLKIQSYVGMPVLTSTGVKIGLLSAMAERTMKFDEASREVLQIAAAQVGAELELASSSQRIRALTYEDPVTGLPNREHLHYVLNAGARALIFIDLRRFKDINDLYGHREGDAVLQAVAQRLTRCLDGLGFVARWAGDQFALVPSAPGDVHDWAARVRQCFDEPVCCGEREFVVDVTLGVAEFDAAVEPAGAAHGHELLRRASVALAEAKSRQLDVAVFEVGMADQRQFRLTLFARLLRALRDERLSLHYQPQFDLASGALIGAEVLCRWYDEEYGWIAPGTFIPLAEERGLMSRLGDWVLEHAGRQLAEWDAQGRSFPGKLSVNVSRQQLEDGDFARRAAELLGPQRRVRVVFELTESVVMHDPELSLAQVGALRRDGFEWAVDDFGTGYSSLSCLTRMDASYLKIDRSFVSRVPGSTHDESVIRTIVAMGESMGMEPIAEGIETEAQRRYLLDIGCRYGQGFLLGKPVPADVFARNWLKPAT